MKTFKYKAFNSDAETVSGRIESADAAGARRQLASRGLNVVSVSACAVSGSSFSLSFLDYVFARRIRAVAFLFHSLSVLMDSGCSLSQSIELILDGEEGGSFRRILFPLLSRVKVAVDGGSSLALAFKNAGAGFSPMHTAMLEAGEKSGRLKDVFDSISRDCERSVVWNKKLRSAVAYPIFVCSFAALVLWFQIFFVMPGYMDVYLRLNVPVPGFIVGFADFMRRGGVEFFIVFFVMEVVLSYVFRHRMMAFTIRMLLKVSFLKKLSVLVFKRNLFYSLSVMTESGVPFIKAFKCVLDGLSADNPKRRELESVYNSVSSGALLFDAFKTCSFISALELRMLKLAQDGADMDGALKMIEKKNEEVFNDSVEGCLALIEPVLTFGVGLVVAAAALAFVLPVYYLSDGF